MEASDAELARRVREGDKEAFHELVGRHGRSLYRLAYRMTSNRDDADDLVQESFLRAYRNLGKYDGRAGFGTWLHRITLNCCLDLLRARQTHRETGGIEAVEALRRRGPAAGEEAEAYRLRLSGEIRKLVGVKLAQLSATERAAFLLRHVEGRPIEEISRLTGNSSGSVRQSLFRAVRKLRTSLEPLVGATS